MRISFQLAFIVLVGLGSLYAGGSNMVSPATVFSSFYSVDLASLGDTTRLAIESQTRLLAGMWIAAGLVSFFVIENFESHTSALRLILLGLALGSIGEFSSVVLLGGDTQPAFIKMSVQAGIYIGLEAWRAYLCKKAVSK